MGEHARLEGACLPIIDVSPLTGAHAGSPPGDLGRVVAELREACLKYGFFYAKGHGIDQELITRLFSEGRRFFATCPAEEKQRIHMRHNAVFRGWFELQGEYTAHRKDFKVWR